MDETTDVLKPREADEAADNNTSLVLCMTERTEIFRTICFLLKECKDKRHYKASADSWAEYAAGIGLTLSKANKMVKFATILAAAMKQVDNQDGLSLGNADDDRLLNGWLPCVKYDKKSDTIEKVGDAVELLSQATTLSHSDFQAVKDQHKQAAQHPEVQPVINEGPVLDENKNVIGNYRNTKATGKQHYFTIGISDEYIKGKEGQEIKVSLAP